MAAYVDEGVKTGWNWALRGRRDRDRIQGILDGIVLDGRLTWTEISGLAEALAQTDPSHRRHWPLSAIDGAVQRWLGAVPPGAPAPREALEEFQTLADAPPPPKDDPFDDHLDQDEARHVLQAMIAVTEGVVLDGVCTWTELEQMSVALEDLPRGLRGRWPLDRLGDLVEAALAETPPGEEAPTGFVQELARMVRSASIGRVPGPNQRAACPTVEATGSLARTLKVARAPEATAWRSASEPEWNQVPSPTLTKRCSCPTNGASPAQSTPSAPMWAR